MKARLGGLDKRPLFSITLCITINYGFAAPFGTECAMGIGERESKPFGRTC